MSQQKKQIVHLIPKGVLDNSYHGSFKDVISRVRMFERSDADYHQVILDDDDPERVLSVSAGWESPSFLIEYSYYPRIVRALRRRFAASFIAVRSHNIEPLQHLHSYGWWPSRGPFWVGYGMTRLLWGDALVKRHADVIYSISDWERTKYWKHLPGKATTKWLPYFCPDHLVDVEPKSGLERNRIVCMPTSVKSRKSLDLVRRFISFAELATKLGSPDEFLITGDLESWPAPQSSAVAYTGMIDDLGPFFGSVKAVCILSDLGYGFKTTIADAMANGVAVLVHEKLRRRFSSMLGDALIAVDAFDSESVRNALSQLDVENFSLKEKNTSLRRKSEKILTNDFCLGDSE